jgi:hypothetical protein
MSIKFELSDDKFASVVKSIGLLPYYVAAPILAELQVQVAEQTKSKEPPNIVPENTSGAECY